MKSLIISLIIISLTVALAVFNGIYTEHAVKDIINLIENCAADDLAVQKGIEAWTKCRPIFDLTLHASDIKNVDESFYQLMLARNKGEKAELAAAKDVLVYKLEDIIRAQTLDIKTLL